MALEVGLVIGLLSVVLLVTYGVALPLARLLELHGVRPLIVASDRMLTGYPSWVRGLIVDGVIRGTGTVATLVPMLAVLFGAAGLLAETGWLARAAMATERVTGRRGLGGALVCPLCFGFACNVPAVVALRSVPVVRERLAATMLAPFVPCSARLALVALLTPVFFGSAAVVVACGLVSLNLGLFALGGWCLLRRQDVRPGPVRCAVDLPRHQHPSIRTCIADVIRPLSSFIRSAGPIVLVLSALTGLLTAVPGGAPERSVLAQIGQSLEPAMRQVGLDDWRLIAGLLASTVTRESGVAVLGVAFGAGADADGTGLRQVMAGEVSPRSALAFLVVQMLFIPCVPTLAAMARQTGSWTWPLLSAAVMLAVSLAMGTVVYQAGRFL